MYKYILLILPFIISCQTKDMDCVSYYKVPHCADKESYENLTKSVELTQIAIDSTVECSGVGKFWLCNDTLCFTDTYFNYVFWLGTNGDVLKQQVGKGKGPNEVIDCEYSLAAKNDYMLFNSGNWNLSTFNHKGVKKVVVNLGFLVDKKTSLEMLEKPDPKNIACYEIGFGEDRIMEVWNDDHIAVSLCDYLPSFNGYSKSEQFYKYSRILSIVNRNTGKVERIFGRRSPLYLEKSNIPNFNFFSFEVLPECVLVNFQADEKIYALDKKKDKALYSFGIAGRDMNIKYRQTQTFEDGEANWREDQEIYGYYKNLKYDEKTGFVIRTYSKGSYSNTDGLQIYKEKKLLVDIDVPEGFRVIGFVKDKLYASVFNEDKDDSIRLYQVKINDLIN